MKTTYSFDHLKFKKGEIPLFEIVLKECPAHEDPCTFCPVAIRIAEPICEMLSRDTEPHFRMMLFDTIIELIGQFRLEVEIRAQGLSK